MSRTIAQMLAPFASALLLAGCMDGSIVDPDRVQLDPPRIGVHANVHGTADVVLIVGQTVQVPSVVAPYVGDLSLVSWRSGDEHIVRVGHGGVVTAVAPGATELYETSGPLGHTHSVRVDGSAAVVTDPAAGIVLNVGQTVQVPSQVAAYVGDPGLVNWRSANSAILSVGPGGVVTGIAPGTTELYETSGPYGHTHSVRVDPGGTGAPAAPHTAPPPPPSGSGGSRAELPRAYVDTRYVPGSGRQIRVPAGGDLQAALDAAQPGDEVLLAPGATYTGNYDLGPKAGDGWIIVRPDMPLSSLPPQGTRMTPDLARSLALPRLAAYNSAPVVEALPGARGWRLVGLELTTDPPLWVNYTLVAFGSGTREQNSYDVVPRRLILDRSWVHGNSGVDIRRGVAVHCAECAVVDSWISDILSADDAAAVWGWNGPGPIGIVNNYLEATGENIMFGGADPAIPGMNPSDIEIRRNHIAKPLAWRGGPYLIKNLIEFKNAVRVLIEGNVLENSWSAGQSGFALVWWATDQEGTAPWATTCDITFRYNRVHNVAGGALLVPHGDRISSPWMTRVTFQHNLFTDVGAPGLGANGRLFWINGGVTDLVIEHNTAFAPVSSLYMATQAGTLSGLSVRDNIIGDGEYNIFNAAGQGIFAIEVVSGTSSAMQGNLVVRPYSVNMGAANYTAASIGDVGFNSWPWDPRLGSWSSFRGRATDGRDPGVDVDGLVQATQGVKLQ